MNIVKNDDNISTDGKFLGPQRTPAAILILWDVLFRVLLLMIPRNLIFRVNVFWWILNAAAAALVVLLLASSKKAGPLIPIGILLILSLINLIKFFGVGRILIAAAYTAIFCVGAAGTLCSSKGRSKSFPRILHYLPFGLYLSGGLVFFIMNLIRRYPFAHQIIFFIEDMVIAVAFLLLAKAYVAIPRQEDHAPLPGIILGGRNMPAPGAGVCAGAPYPSGAGTNAGYQNVSPPVSGAYAGIPNISAPASGVNAGYQNIAVPAAGTNMGEKNVARPSCRQPSPAQVQSAVPSCASSPGVTGPGVLLVRFSIDKLNNLNGAYGWQSGRLIGQAVPAALLEGTVISDGDSAATLAGREYVCLVSIASGSFSFLKEKVEPLILQNKEICENGAFPLTQVVSRTSEPLVMDGVVRNGKIVGSGGWCANGMTHAWEQASLRPGQSV